MWLMLEYAMTRFRSVSAKATKEPKNALMTPKIAIH